MFKEKNSGAQASGSSLVPANTPRKLSTRDVALGLGRKATEEELKEYLNRPHGKAILLDQAIANIKAKLKKKRSQRKQWK